MGLQGVKKNQSVRRVLDIMEAMAEKGEPIRQQELAETLGMAVPTVYRFLQTLVDAGYVKQEAETLRYYLTFKICEVANRVHDNFSIRKVAYPVIKQLAQTCQESACLVVEEDLMAVYVEKVEGPDKMIRGYQRIGKRAPLYCSGVGKLFLSELDQQAFDTVVERGLVRYTDKTITTPQALQEELQKIRKKGYALDDEECEIGARCLAAPVRDYSGNIVAAISISGPSGRLTDAAIAAFTGEVLRAAEEISETLGYRA